MGAADAAVNLLGSGGGLSGGVAGTARCLLTNAAFTLSNSAAAAITFASEIQDTHGFHDNATNNSRVTIPAGLDGTYLVTVHGNFAADNVGERFVDVFVNGATIEGGGLGFVNAVAAGRVSCSAVLVLAAGDYVEARGFQDSGGNLNIDLSLSVIKLTS